MTTNSYFRNKTKRYYTQKGRNFFWRREKLSAFQVLITELFLKKTRAETVDRYMNNFIKKCNTNRKIQGLNKKYIFKQVSMLGLGKQRTVALMEISNYINVNYNGKVPANIEELMGIPHVGQYIANATLCFGFNTPALILDVNTTRVISRFFSIRHDKDIRENNELISKAKQLVPRIGYKEYNWGLLDIGARICKPKPECEKCPLSAKCACLIRKRIY